MAQVLPASVPAVGMPPGTPPDPVTQHMLIGRNRTMYSVVLVNHTAESQIITHAETRQTNTGRQVLSSINMLGNGVTMTMTPGSTVSHLYMLLPECRMLSCAFHLNGVRQGSAMMLEPLVAPAGVDTPKA
jgi:hypothetical protein